MTSNGQRQVSEAATGGTNVEMSSWVSRLLALAVGASLLVATPSTASADDAGIAEPDPVAADATPSNVAPADAAAPDLAPLVAPIQVPSTEASEPAPVAATPMKIDVHAIGDEKKKDAKKKKHGKLELQARVLVRAAVTEVRGAGDATEQTKIQSARAKADYRWKKQLRAKVSVELARKARLKNAYVQLRLVDAAAAKVSVRAGQFKMPFSAIQLESFWNLPTADRGLLHDVLVKRFQVAGRARGATVNVELPTAWKPELTAGVFQGNDDAGEQLMVSADDRFGQDGVVRVTAKPARGLELGAGGQLRVGKLLVLPAVVRRAWATELDATFDIEAGPGRVRAWVEGMVGTSWLVAEPSKSQAFFVEGRGILAYRIGDTKFGRRYVEPYALVGALDPDSDIRNDAVVEFTGGLTYGATDAWRVQLEIERFQIGSNAPVGIVELGVAPATSTTVMLQLGARL